MFRPIPPTTQTLIGLNVIAFALQMMLGGAFFGQFALWPLGPEFAPWQVVTYGFLAPMMVERGWGRIINQSSTGAYKSGTGHYTTTKTALVTDRARLIGEELGTPPVPAGSTDLPDRSVPVTRFDTVSAWAGLGSMPGS